MVLLKGDNNLHKMTKICFLSDEFSNFAIIIKIDESCSQKVI